MFSSQLTITHWVIVGKTNYSTKLPDYSHIRIQMQKQHDRTEDKQNPKVLPYKPAFSKSPNEVSAGVEKPMK